MSSSPSWRTWKGGHFGWVNSMTGTKSTSIATFSASITIVKVSAGPDFFSDTFKQYASVQCHRMDLNISCYNELINPVKWRHKSDSKFPSNVLMITKATLLCLKFHKLHPPVLQISVLLTWRWVWNICAIIMREKILYQYNLVYQKSHADWPMLQHVPPM